MKSLAIHRTHLLIVLIPLILSGCGITLTTQQKKILNSYASAASAGGTQAADDLKKAYNDHVYANRQIIVLNGMSNNIPLAKLEGPITGNDRDNRVEAATALAKYGELIQLLSSTYKGKKFKTLASKTVGGINEFDSDLIDDNLKKGVEQAVMVVGGLFIERKKTKAIQDVIIEFEDPVNEACDLLMNDLNVEEGEGIAYYVETVCRDLDRESKRILRKQDSTIPIRDVAMKAQTFAFDTKKRVGKRSKVYSELLLKLKESNSSLAEAVEKGIPHDFDILIDEVKGLSKLVKKLTEDE